MKKNNNLGMNILLTIEIVFLLILILVLNAARKPEIVMDYGSFAIVKIDGELWIWNRDIYGEGYYRYNGENYDY